MTISHITENWKAIREQIAALHPLAKLIAVSKAQPRETVLPLLEAGQRDFAENRVQEALSKWPELIADYPDVKLHLIGPLQSNKVKEALSLFNAIHTVDRKSLVDALVRARSEGRGASCKEFFIQVNIGQEPQKNGIIPSELPSLMEYIHASRPSPLAPLPITGLMCIPPMDEPPAPHFALLRTLAQKLGLACLSMGMSGDYKTALRLGATHIRVGTALFGKRED